jgi:hypothetical protein
MITGGNGVGRCRDDDDDDDNDDFAAGWICTATTYPLLLLVLPLSSSARRPGLPFPHPPCSSPGHLASHMHSSPFVLPLLLRFAAPRPNRIPRGFATARWLLPGAVNGQREMKTCKSLPMGGDGRVGTAPELVFFHLLIFSFFFSFDTLKLPCG